jgi:hypothetical protein
MASEIWLAVLGAVVLVGVPIGYYLLGRRARRRHIGGPLLGVFEELYDPVRHNATVEVQVQAEREEPAPAPGDPPWKTPPPQ